MTYPIQSKLSKLLDLKIILILLLVAVIIFLVQCPHKSQPVLQPVTPIAEQKERIKIINELSDLQRDSINKITGKLEEVAATAIFERDNAQADNLQLQKEMDGVLSQPVPDTCEPFRKAVDVLNKKLSQSAIKAQDDCSKALQAQKSIIANKDKIIEVDHKQVYDLRASLDTAFAQQSKLQANIKTLKPRASIGVGVIGEAAWVSPYKFDAGFQIYYHSKNGTQIGVGVLSSQRAQITYSKTLIKL